MTHSRTLLRSFRTIFQDWRYVNIALVAAAALGYVNYWLLYKVTTIPDFFRMAYEGEYGSFSVPYAWTSSMLTVLTILLFGIGSATLYWLYHHSSLKAKGVSLAGGGALSSAFGSACPVCGAFLVQLVGITSGVTAFPLKGLEFKILSFGLIAASTLLSLNKVEKSKDNCGSCVPNDAKDDRMPQSPMTWRSTVTSLLIAVLALNHILIGQTAAAMGMLKPSGKGVIASLFGVKSASARTIIATKVNPDGRTTTLAEWPTISEVPANPNTGDAVADAKTVMVPAGVPFYAPEGISFDDPVGALAAWGRYEDSITLTGELESRYQKIISTMTCDYCCGSPSNVTIINNCGCNHAKAWRSIAKYLLQNYGDKYSDDEILGELKIWRGAWYPKGAVEDYLLATGKGDVIGHETHGGAGADGKHGF